MIEPCAPDDAGLAFKGPEEALSSVLAYAKGIGATLLWREDERVSGPFLLMRYRTAEQVRPAEQLHRAFTEGMFPDVEAFVLEPADESLRRKMRGF